MSELCIFRYLQRKGDKIMKITDLNYKGGIDWEIDTKNMDFYKCEEMPQKKPLKLRGVFITPDNGYGPGAVAILDDVLLNLPQRYVETVDTILSDDEMIEEIKTGKVAIEISTFTSKKYKKVGYDVR